MDAHKIFKSRPLAESSFNTGTRSAGGIDFLAFHKEGQSPGIEHSQRKDDLRRSIQSSNCLGVESSRSRMFGEERSVRNLMTPQVTIPGVLQPMSANPPTPTGLSKRGMYSSP